MGGLVTAFVLDHPAQDEAQRKKLAEIARWFAAHRCRHLTIVGAGDADPSGLSSASMSVSLLAPLSGRAVVVEAVRALAASGRSVEGLGERIDKISGPAPDLIIFAGRRISLGGAFTWSAAYAEFVFLKRSWSGASLEDFEAALAEFAKRDRRFGTLGTR